MSQFRNGLFLGIFAVILSIVIGWWINRPTAKIYDDQAVVVESVNVTEAEWEYQFYTGSYFRFTLISDDPLGYSVGDTLQFAGDGHPCDNMRRSYTTDRNDPFEPKVEKPE